MESGLKKYEIIAPLLNEGLEAAEKRRLRNEIMIRHSISERTLRRYLEEFRNSGYDGLLKQPKSSKGLSKTIPVDVMEKAIELRRELPSRSIRRILAILEGEGLISKGAIPKSTLSRQMQQRGFGAGRIKSEARQTAGKRFQKEHRNALWQADVKYGPYIPGKNGKKIRTYMLAFIDDATRMIMHAEFYDNQRLPILEDAFRKALLKFGRPQIVYVDNGKIFVSKWFRLACARLKVEHATAKPFHPQGKGKIEKFNNFVSQFLEELSLEPPDSLETLNQKFRVWLDEGYIHKKHDSLVDQTPYQAYQADAAKVRFVSQQECHDLFLWEQTRTVDNSGCVSISGVEYEAGAEFVRKKVDVRYDPFDLSVVEIWRDGQRMKQARPIVISEFIPKSQIPAQLSENIKKPTKSRLLAVYEKQSSQRDQRRNGAISYRNLKDDSNV